MRRPPLHRLILFLLLVWGATVATALGQPQTILRLQPQSIQAAAGRSIELRVVIDGVQNLGAFQFTLVYDPEIVKVEAVSVGDFPASTGRSVNPLGPKVENGRALFGAFSFGDAPGPNGNGVLAVVTLVAKGPGESELRLDDVQVVDIAGNRIPATVENGSIRITGTPVAQPKEASPTVTTTTVTTTPTTSLPLTATLTAMREGESRSGSPGATWREWAIVLVVLVGAIALVALLARQLARSVP